MQRAAESLRLDPLAAGLQQMFDAAIATTRLRLRVMRGHLERTQCWRESAEQTFVRGATN